ncbi:MAG: hypothetical protein EAZ70_12605 [Runella slithyformis]|nr:MAG: hypothetical protein EAY79_08665 [Runella slithyformis]TAF23794.1 MAG: hypothetical protein EAZ70_12605 [Runella slithyformis]TAG21037.1 MAG: hypothetical protein EAZ38_08910 [Cytophagales bacterium]TAG40407.1 MAG: hypothetical protein EAZ32_06635 [Cytophagia bacterium]TAG81992.1 MAG: hypothetical protein EAZ22_06185 [Cytophagales bacterium]
MPTAYQRSESGWGNGIGYLLNAVWLTQTHGVACIPVSAFYRHATDHGVVRFCFAKKQETLDQAVAKLRAV